MSDWDEMAAELDAGESWQEQEQRGAEEADEALDRRQEEALELREHIAESTDVPLTVLPTVPDPIVERHGYLKSAPYWVRGGISLRDLGRATDALAHNGTSLKDVMRAMSGPPPVRSVEQWERDCQVSLAFHQARRKASPHPFPRDLVEAVVIGCLSVLVVVVGYLFLFSVWVA